MIGSIPSLGSEQGEAEEHCRSTTALMQIDTNLMEILIFINLTAFSVRRIQDKKFCFLKCLNHPFEKIETQAKDLQDTFC